MQLQAFRLSMTKTMIVQTVFLFLLLGSTQLVAASELCPLPSSLSTECSCEELQTGAMVTCVYADYRSVDQILPNNVQNPVHLHVLNISGNSLIDLPVDYFNKINSIHHVDMSGNKFKRIPKSLKNVTTIFVLDLSNNELQTMDLSGFENLNKLRQLDLSNNSVTEINHEFNGFQDLHVLNLASNNIAEIKSDSFNSLSYLKSLSLAGNKQLSSVQHVAFPEHISMVDLSSTNIKSLNECGMQSLHDLELLPLKDTPIACSCSLVTMYKRIKANHEGYSLHEHKQNPDVWQCTLNGSVVNITNLYDSCTQDTNTRLCVNPAEVYRVETEYAQAESEFNIKITEYESEQVALKWDSLNSSLVFGYKVVIRKQGENDEVYSSLLLHPEARSHKVLSNGIKSGTFDVCVQIYKYNSTTLSKESCKIISVSSLTVIVGILAGVVFIVPFMIILACVIKKDLAYMKTERKYTKLHPDEAANSMNNKTSSASLVVVVEDEKTQKANDSKNKTPITSTESAPNNGMTNPTFVNDSPHTKTSKMCIELPINQPLYTNQMQTVMPDSSVSVRL